MEGEVNIFIILIYTQAHTHTHTYAHTHDYYWAKGTFKLKYSSNWQRVWAAAGFGLAISEGAGHRR